MGLGEDFKGGRRGVEMGMSRVTVSNTTTGVKRTWAVRMRAKGIEGVVEGRLLLVQEKWRACTS